ARLLRGPGHGRRDRDPDDRQQDRPAELHRPEPARSRRAFRGPRAARARSHVSQEKGEDRMQPSRVPFITLILVLVFFYLPIGFLVLNSFNDSRYASKWNGFTMRWYERLFERSDILAALGNSVKVATAASL